MLVYETKIGILQYFLSSLSCFYIIPISFFTIFQNERNDIGLISIGIITVILGIIQFSYTLKSFKIYSDYFVVNRPMFILNQNKKFHKNEIDRIYFRISSSRIGGGYYLIVKTKKDEESYMLIHSKETLKELILKLKAVGIDTVDYFK